MRPGGQREKGKAFERKIARQLRTRWPGALVRRASQAERAHNPDVFVEGGPRILQRLWMELQDSAQPAPGAKLAQARRDVAADPRRYADHERRVPIAITHQRGSRAILATMAMADLVDVLAPRGRVGCAGDVTMSIEVLLDAIARGAATEAEVA